MLNMILYQLIFIVVSDSARILGVIPSVSYSHQVVFRPIWNELSRRGHDVVVITTDPQNDPTLNITEIDLSFCYETGFQQKIIKAMNDHTYNMMKIMDDIVNATNELSIRQLLHPGVQGILRNKSEHFDLVMVEYLYPTMFLFSERFKCPYIGLVSLDLPSPYHGLLGNPTHPVLYPESVNLGFYGKLSFWERVLSVTFAVVFKLILSFPEIFYENPVMSKVIEAEFGTDLPPMSDIVKNVSVILINENPIFNTRPLGPGFILFGGGVHLEPQKELPKDLKEYLDAAENGFIYFSLGTNIKSDIFLPDKRKQVLDAFKELPYKVLWKFDVTDIPDAPDNVKIVTWLPQQDILRHPKIKVFITQGGLQSSEEAIFCHVPIVGIPYIADQVGNVKRIVAKGGGVMLDKNSFTKQSFKEAVLEVINNPKYKESITEIAELSRDQPMTGIEKAIWWTEYVIRRKGARHLRNAAMDIPSYQYYMLDVIGFYLVIISILLYIVFKLIIFTKNLIVKLCVTKNKIKSQ